MVQNDRYFGFEDTAVFCQTYIHSLFAPGPQPAVEAGAKAGPPHLGEFIAYALYRTRLPVCITHQALLLLARLKARYPSARGTSTSPHRLFLSSLMLSSKISLDDSFSNASWTIVGQGLFELREVNQMERELFAFLGWNVVVRDEELAQWTREVVEPYEAAKGLAVAAAAVAPVASTSTVAAPTQRKSMEERKRRRDHKVGSSPVSSSSRSSSTSSRSSSVDSMSSCSSTSTRSSSCDSSRRSPSPDELRHRRASDAALAILHGPGAASGLMSGAGASRSSRRTRGTRTPSPYSSRPGSHPSSSSSSMLSSPVSGATTPGSPCTPSMPLTPDHKHSAAPSIAWTEAGYSFPAKPTNAEVAYTQANDQIEVSSW